MEVGVTKMEGAYPSLSIDRHRYEFLSFLWAKSLNGEQSQVSHSYVSNQPKTVFKCENLSVKVPIKKKCSLQRAVGIFKQSHCDPLPGSNEIILLDQVSAEVRGGEILAVLGPSGAGKTLFLSALLGHPSVNGGQISGDVFLNGHRMTDKIMEGSTAFVPQKDLTVESLTIDEHLRFFASLRLWREPNHVRIARINELILQMNLESCRSRKIRSLSNGEKRRVGIASQMIAPPAVLLLDEPLTGLDAAVADTVIAAVARAAQPTPTSPGGCAVVCVLHQPRPQTLRFVSNVMLIADGRLAFYGTRNEAEQFYRRINPTAETQYGAWYAILESLIDSLHRPEAADYIVATYRDDVRSKTSIKNTSSTMEEVNVSLPPPITRASWRTQMKWLLWREMRDAKNLRVFDLASCLFLAVAVMIGVLFIRSSERTSAGIQTAGGFLFMVTSEIIYTNAYGVLYSFTPQVPILLREKRLYGPSAYYMSKILSLLPRAILQTILFASVVHVFGNLGGDSGMSVFLPICGILTLVCIAATSFGCMLAGISDGVERAYTIAQPLDLIANSLGGIFGNTRNNPHVFHVAWLKFISVFYYSFECNSILYWNSVKDFDCPAGVSRCPTAKSILDGYGFSNDHLYRNIIFLFVYITVCYLIGFVGLWIKFKNHCIY